MSNKIKLVGLAITFLVIGFISGKFSRQSNPDQNFDRGSYIRESGFSFINPILDCEISQTTEFTELKPFRTELNALVSKEINSKRASHVSVYFRDLNNGPWIGINEKGNFSPASLLKVPLSLAIYKKAESEPDLLKKTLTYSGQIEKDKLQTISPDVSIKPDHEYAVAELVNIMLQYSDNNAAEVLTRIIDTKTFLEPYQDLGLALPTNTTEPYNIRVKDYASFFRVLFNSSYLSREYSNKLLETMSQSHFKEGLEAGLPSDIKVAHKFGERLFENSSEKQLHDCGIVYYPAKPYLLCVMTRGENMADLKSIIANISKETYDNVSSQLKARSAKSSHYQQLP